MLWHRHAIFKSKGDKLSSSAVCRIWTRVFGTESPLNARWQTDWAIEDQAKNLNSTARPYDQRAFSPLEPPLPFGFRTWLWWYTCLLLISMLSHRQAILKSKGDACMRAYVRTDIQTYKHTYIHTYIHVCCWFRCSGTGKRYSNLKETSCLPLLKAGFEPGSLKTLNRQQTECPLTNRLSYRGSS